jgi:hypothetical protein
VRHGALGGNRDNNRQEPTGNRSIFQFVQPGCSTQAFEEGRREKRDASEEVFAGERRSRARDAGGQFSTGLRLALLNIKEQRIESES